jgi:ABC-type polysaccharide/polyol phosphate transport system ATPase subunit
VERPAIEVGGVSKTFIVPHERHARLKEYFVRPFRRRAYDRNVALDNVSLKIAPGEFFGIIGRNGSGKSTLLRILAGIYRADSGTVELNGIVSPFIELGVGFNFELTARDNIYLNGTLIGLSRREIDERLDAIVRFAELERFLDQQVKNFSSGMMMRLAYSISVQVTFDILLVDEVLAVGDANFKTKCFETFRQMREERKTVVFVSHDLKSVQEFCDRVLLLDGGRTLAIGEPDEIVDLYERRVRAVAGPSV